MFTVFKLATGEIVGTISIPDADLDANVDEAEGIISGDHDGDEMYVADWQAVPRPVLPEPTATTLAADGVETIAWAGLPEGTEVRVDRVPAGVVEADGALAFRATIAADYLISLRPPFPARPVEWTVTCS